MEIAFAFVWVFFQSHCKIDRDKSHTCYPVFSGDTVRFTHMNLNLSDGTYKAVTKTEKALQAEV